MTAHSNALLIYALNVSAYIALNFTEHFASQQNTHDSVFPNLIFMQ